MGDISAIQWEVYLQCNTSMLHLLSGLNHWFSTIMYLLNESLLYPLFIKYQTHYNKNGDKKAKLKKSK